MSSVIIPPCPASVKGKSEILTERLAMNIPGLPGGGRPNQVKDDDTPEITVEADYLTPREGEDSTAYSQRVSRYLDGNAVEGE